MADLAGAEPRLRVDDVTAPLAQFTPSLTDAPGLALKPGAQVNARQFRFTPTGARSARRALTVGARVAASEAPRAGEAPQAFDLGMSLGMRGLAVSSTMRRVDAGLAQREAVTLGLGYGRRDWSTTLRVGEEDGWLRGVPTVKPDKRYSVELGGAYALGRSVKLGGGVRYRVAPQDVVPANRPPDDRSAFLGLGVAF